jgi:hypothetical protein
MLDRSTGINGYTPARSSEVFPLATGPVTTVNRLLIHRSMAMAVSAPRP